MNPGASKFIEIGFNTPCNEKAFTINPGSLVAGWSADIAFMVQKGDEWF